MKRAAMVALIAAILGGAVFAIFYAPWYTLTTWSGKELDRTFFELDVDFVVVQLIAILVAFYFFVRLFFTGILVVIGGPTRSRVVAWYTPQGAHLQGAFALAAAVTMYANPPEPYGLFELDASRSWGGLVFIGCTALSHVAIFCLKHVRSLAYTQAWVDDDGRPLPKPRHRWLRVKPQERPMVKSPLVGGVNVDADPFRAGVPLGLDAKIVKPKKHLEAPRIEDKNAPPPKLLT